MKKALSVLLAAALLGGCAAPAASTADTPTDSPKTLRVVSTIFPVYDWVRTVAGPETDALDLTLLLDGSTDLHSYQPTAEDVAAIAACDLFVYVGVRRTPGWRTPWPSPATPTGGR